jgi:hypothetical protein
VHENRRSTLNYGGVAELELVGAEIRDGWMYVCKTQSIAS